MSGQGALIMTNVRGRTVEKHEIGAILDRLAKYVTSSPNVTSVSRLILSVESFGT